MDQDQFSAEDVKKAIEATFKSGNFDAGIREREHVIYGDQEQTFIADVLGRLSKKNS